MKIQRLRIAAKECNYQELDTQVKEQFINDINDENMLIEIHNNLTAITNTSKVTSNLVFMWEMWVGDQRTQTAARSKLEVNEQADVMQPEKHNIQNSQPRMYKYCRSSNPPQSCPVYGKRCWGMWQDESL